MTSDEERRRAVAELREASTGAYRHVDALDVIAGSVGVDADGKFDHDIEKETYAALADLIEPVPERTCRMIDNGAELCCSECDWRHDYDDEPKFCAGCGAEVVRTSD